MTNKIFGDKKINIRRISKSDLKRLKLFQEYINLLIEEKAMLLLNKKQTLQNEKDFIEKTLLSQKNKSGVCIIAEHDGKIVGLSDVKLKPLAKNHIGLFGISVRQGYRGIGLGKYLMSEVLKLAKKELLGLKIFELEVYKINKPARVLYKKMGFKDIAKIPRAIQHKGKLEAEYLMMKEVK
jgi:ribosomal protein S18 acetylase RimI-like enzyme